MSDKRIRQINERLSLGLPPSRLTRICVYVRMAMRSMAR